MKILNLNIDQHFTNSLIGTFDLVFKHVHPTLLTFLGLFTDFIILYFAKQDNLFLLPIFLFARYSFDCLDGAVARKYGKVSNFGGLMDTIADSTLIYILSFLITDNLYISTTITLLNLFYLFHTKSLIHHYNIKKEGNFFHNIYRFGVNNNILLYIISYIIIVLK
jgi:phosphatidylglycerophosphate synthase